jgi:hypothetical protein
LELTWEVLSIGKNILRDEKTLPIIICIIFDDKLYCSQIRIDVTI